MPLQRLWGFRVGEAGRPRRQSSPSPVCESLEGRQLLSTASLHHGGLGSSFTQRAHPAQFAQGGTVASQDVGQGAGHARRLHVSPGAGTMGTRNALRMTRLQTLSGGTNQAVPATPPATTAAPGSTVPVVASQSIAAMPVQDGTPGAMSAGTPAGAVWSWASGASDGWSVPNAPATGTSTSDDAASKAFEKLHTDLQAVQDKSEVTPKELAAVRDDLKALTAAATTNVGADALKTFTTDVQNLDGQLPTDAQRDQLVADFNAVVKSRGITDQTLIDKTVADVEAVAQSTHITSDDLALIAADRKAIATAIGADTNTSDATAVKPAPSGAPTEILLAGLTGGNLSGMPIGGGQFAVAMNGAPFGGPMGGPKFTMAPGNAAFGRPMGGGSFNVMTTAAPFGGPMGGGSIQTFTQGGPMGNVRFGGPRGY